MTDNHRFIFDNRTREVVCECGKKFSTTSTPHKEQRPARCPECRAARKKVTEKRANARSALKRRGVLVTKPGFGK